MATDRGSPALVGSATLTVMVIDTNDNRPTIPQPWELRVSEGEDSVKREVQRVVEQHIPLLGAPGVSRTTPNTYPLYYRCTLGLRDCTGNRE